MLKRISLLFFTSLLAMNFNSEDVSAQRPGINQDESKVPIYELPRLLECIDGSMVESTKDWESKRRPELLSLFSDHVYGNFPNKDISVTFEVGESWEALNGRAIRKQIKLKFGKSQSATVLLTLPKSSEAVPCFVGYNFHGNHTTTDDPKVSIPTSWVRNNEDIKNNQAREADRGKSASRWPYEAIISRGFGVATIYYGDVDPDFDDQFKNGIHPLFYKPEQTQPTKDQWGSIGAWAWALSRTLDYLETEKEIDSKRVAVIGHSRLGKTSLWAGATDERFWLTVSNNSGCGGAALHRRKFGETVKVINTNFPHWFCDQFATYNDENSIPVDQHQLISLIAPRLVYVASASKDLWADPKGEYLSLAKSNPVFELYGDKPLKDQMPEIDTPAFTESRGYHIRSGKHDITSFDWKQYLEFATQRLNKE